MKNNTYTVYMHICPNGKKYIGITKQKPKYRWNNGKGYLSNEYFANAIKKYGWDNIKHEILYTNLIKEEACKKEIELISYYKSNNRKFGYNIEIGGNIKIPTQETKIKISKTLKKYKRNYKGQFKKNCIPWITGKNHTKETKEKMSLAKIGEKNPMFNKQVSEETRKKLSEKRLGYKLKKETKIKIGLANSKKVICLDTNKIYNSIFEASQKTNTCRSSIIQCCKNKRKTAGNLHWKYYN